MDHRAGMRTTFGGVRVEQCVAREPFDHHRQLPAEVARVANAAVVALALPDRHEVRGVAGKQHAVRAKRAGDARVVGVDAMPNHVDPVRVRHRTVSAPGDEAGLSTCSSGSSA